MKIDFEKLDRFSVSSQQTDSILESNCKITKQNLNVFAFQARLHSALSKPLYQRCTDVRKLLDDTSSKELHTILATLVESIFGFGNQAGWGIGRINKSQSYDFLAVRQLLHPEGSLLKLVYKLMTDPFYRYEFPLSCLPYPVQKMIEEGAIPAFFADNLQLNANGRPHNMLSLNAFEYYFYHFAYFLVNPQAHRMSPWTNPSEALFTVILEEYLNYFLPPDGKTASQVPPSGGVNTPIAPSSPMRPSPGMVGRSTPLHARTPASSLLAQRVCSPYSTPMVSPINLSHYSTPVGSPGMGAGHVISSEPVQQETWRSHTFLQIIVEFWLHQTSLELDKYVYLNSSTESFLPSADHVRVVRMLVKHLHYFVNSVASDVMLSPYSPHVNSVWDDFKRAVFPQLVRKKLYAFLKHSFERWPLDASFRLILETWLSYIQPWRYTDPAQSNREREQDIKDRTIEEKWRQFLVENLLFYTVLYYSFITRVTRTELTAPKNAYILFRVSKVFSLPNLRDMIEDAEGALYESIHQLSAALSPGSHDMGASYLAPVSHRHSNIASMLANQFTELEGPGFKYTPMFGEETVTMVQQLLQSIVQAKESVAARTQAESSNTSFFSFLGFGSEDYNASKYYGGDGYDDTGGGDVRKVGLHLTSATTNLCHIFQLEAPEKTEKGVKWGKTSPGAITPEVLTPDVDQTEEGPKLGPLGRYQLMNGLRRFEVEYQGDPDLQPIRSFESTWLVRMLYHVSVMINTKYEHQFQTYYQKDDFWGRLSRVFLTPPSVIQSPKKLMAMSPNSQHQLARYQRPRVSLRWLARYHTIFVVCLLYMAAYLFLGLGPVGFILLMIICISFYAVIKVFSQNEDKVKTS